MPYIFSTSVKAIVESANCLHVLKLVKLVSSFVKYTCVDKRQNVNYDEHADGYCSLRIGHIIVSINRSHGRHV